MQPAAGGEAVHAIAKRARVDLLTPRYSTCSSQEREWHKIPFGIAIPVLEYTNRTFIQLLVSIHKLELMQNEHDFSKLLSLHRFHFGSQNATLHLTHLKNEFTPAARTRTIVHAL